MSAPKTVPCVHPNCPNQTTAGRKPQLCSYHRCEICANDKPSSQKLCTTCQGKQAAGQGGLTHSMQPHQCIREGCSQKAKPSSSLCHHHACACGRQKSSAAPKCATCAGSGGAGRAPRPAQPGSAQPGGGRPGAERTDSPAPPPEPPFDLAAALQDVVGLGELKQQLLQIQRAAVLDKRRKLKSASVSSLHMVFTGNPGTGKTSMARMVAKALHASGVIPTDKVVEVQRADLVGKYIGHTAQLTKEKITEAAGGVLFVDEAYRLSQGGSKDYGKEAIEELMAAMIDGKAVIVFAGYPVEMAKFIEMNPGLLRRIRYQLEFPDYTSRDLAAICTLVIRGAGFELASSISEADFSKLIEARTTPLQRSRLNGGLADFVFGGAKKMLDSEIDIDDMHPSVTFQMRHLAAGVDSVPHPPAQPSPGSE